MSKMWRLRPLEGNLPGETNRKNICSSDQRRTGR